MDKFGINKKILIVLFLGLAMVLVMASSVSADSDSCTTLGPPITCVDGVEPTACESGGGVSNTEECEDLGSCLLPTGYCDEYLDDNDANEEDCEDNGGTWFGNPTCEEEKSSDSSGPCLSSSSSGNPDVKSSSSDSSGPDDGCEQIPEYPTAAIPGIIAAGGYLLIRRKRLS